MIEKREFRDECEKAGGRFVKDHICDIGEVRVHWIEEGDGVSIMDKDTDGDVLDTVIRSVDSVNFGTHSGMLNVESKSLGAETPTGRGYSKSSFSVSYLGL